MVLAEVVPKPEQEEAEHVEKIARSTWECLDNLSRTPSGLINDRNNIYITKPTNIGMQLASYLGAEQMGFISAEAANRKISQVFYNLSQMPTSDGLYFDWYSTQTGKPLEVWPGNGQPLKPFVSTVDNAWLFTGLLAVAQAKPEFSPAVNNLFERISWHKFLRPDTGELVGGFDGLTGRPTQWHYGRQYLSESRIMYYLLASRASPEHKPKFKELLKNSNGAYPTNTYGGSLFEALMPLIFVDESQNRDSFSQILNQQIDYGNNNCDGFWGFSVCDDPEMGYQEMGVGGNYKSKSVITPHAICLALHICPAEALAQLKRLQSQFSHIYCPESGFADSIDVSTGRISSSYLALDQAMVFLSLVNYKNDNIFPKLLAPKLN